MNEFYLIWVLCMGGVCGEVDDYHNGNLKTFKTEEACRIHAFMEAPLIKSERLQARAFACRKLIGA